MVCSLCKEHGHNIRTCEARKNYAQVSATLRSQNTNIDSEINEGQHALALDPGYENNLM